MGDLIPNIWLLSSMHSAPPTRVFSCAAQHITIQHSFEGSISQFYFLYAATKELNEVFSFPSTVPLHPSLYGAGSSLARPGRGAVGGTLIKVCDRGLHSIALNTGISVRCPFPFIILVSKSGETSAFIVV